MSRRNLIFLVLFLILVTLFLFLYLYKNKPEPLVPSTSIDSVKIEQINQELTTTSSTSEQKPSKPPEKINKELQSSEVLPPGSPTQEEINNSLVE